MRVFRFESSKTFRKTACCALETGCITEAILVHGQPCPQEYIVDFVVARWRSLKLDGSVFSTTRDPRGATLEQLYTHSTGSSSMPLFEPSRSRPTRWMLATGHSSLSAKHSTFGARRFNLSSAASSPAPTFSNPFGDSLGGRQALDASSYDDDESSAAEGNDKFGSRRALQSSSGSLPSGSMLALPLRNTRARRNKRKRFGPAGDDDSYVSSEEDGLPELPGGRDAAYLLDLPRKKPKVYTPEELSYDASKIPADELLEKVKDSKLTNLQILISISIIKSPNYEARLDYILDFVCQHYTYLLGRDGNPKATDPKRAVLASLSKNASSSPLFVKIGDVWKIGPKNVLYGSKEVIPGLMEYITVSKAPGDAVELTELQKMIMRAISLEGGTCGLEKIYDYVKLRYDRLKRRDGSSYATNARRAIQASLSNNSSNRPIFQLVGSNQDDETLWSLTERGLESLELINTNEPEIPFSLDGPVSPGISESASYSDEETLANTSTRASLSGSSLNAGAPSSAALSSGSPSASPTKFATPSNNKMDLDAQGATASSDAQGTAVNFQGAFQPSFPSFRNVVTSGSLSPSSVTESIDGPSVDESEDDALMLKIRAPTSDMMGSSASSAAYQHVQVPPQSGSPFGAHMVL